MWAILVLLIGLAIAPAVLGSGVFKLVNITGLTQRPHSFWSNYGVGLAVLAVLVSVAHLTGLYDLSPLLEIMLA